MHNDKKLSFFIRKSTLLLIINQHNEYDYICLFIRNRREKRWCCFFLFSNPFFTYENKKTKIILAFFTILSKITLADEKKGSKSSQNVLWKKEWKYPFKIEREQSWNEISSIAIYFFLSGKFFLSYLVLYFGRKRSFASFCLYLQVRRKRSCPIVFF